MQNALRRITPREPPLAPYRHPAQPAWLIGLLLGGFIAALSLWRLVGVDHLLVWHDEVFTLIRVLGHTASEVNQSLFSARLLSPAEVLAFQQGPPESWRATLTALMQHPEHPPLYYLLARALLALPLDPIIAMRGLAAAFGALLPLAAFWLMHELFARGAGQAEARGQWRQPPAWSSDGVSIRSAPWLAALLVAVSPLHLLYAQEGRQYALWTLLVIAASAGFVRALRTDGKATWSGYSVLLALALHTHLLSVLLIPLHALFGLLTCVGHPDWQEKARARITRFTLAVGAAVLVFIPWLVLMAVAADRVDDFTSWMERPIPLSDILLAWRAHLTRLFIDIQPGGGDAGTLAWSALLLLPILWALGYYLIAAPRPAVWLPPLLALAFIGVVLGPDLLLGGSRSQHPRYALPGLVALQLMLAWSLAQALEGASIAWRRAATALLTALVAAGLWSFAVIASAESWWNKNFSAGNQDVARLINAAPTPLLVVSPSGVGTGELISLAYHLDPRVRVWGEPGGGTPVTIPAGFSSLFALTPSAELSDAVRSYPGASTRAASTSAAGSQPVSGGGSESAPDSLADGVARPSTASNSALRSRSLRPLPGHWQWFQALPVNVSTADATHVGDATALPRQDSP